MGLFFVFNHKARFLSKVPSYLIDTKVNKIFSLNHSSKQFILKLANVSISNKACLS